MRISVTDYIGRECEEVFSYDTTMSSECTMPARAKAPALIDALREAARFLGAAGSDRLAPTGEMSQCRGPCGSQVAPDGSCIACGAAQGQRCLQPPESRTNPRTAGVEPDKPWEHR